MRTSDRLSYAIQKRVIQVVAFVIRKIEWETLTAEVEFKHIPGALAKARIATISGTWGTLYPPLVVGDVVEGHIHGPDLSDVLESRRVRPSKNLYLYDRSDVTVGFGLLADSGEDPDRLAVEPPEPGSWLLHHRTGARFEVTPEGDIISLPAAGRKIYLGGKTGARAVVADGDSAGDSSVSASQSTVMLGSP